jgi:uncharacterized protein YprB with RNaseH-like and TPR domain
MKNEPETGGESLRSRMERINRGPLRRDAEDAVPLDEIRRRLGKPGKKKDVTGETPAREPVPVVFNRSLPRKASPRVTPKPSKYAVVLEDAVAGDVVQDPDFGPYYFVVPTSEQLEGVGQIAEAFRQGLDRDGSGLRQELGRVVESNEITYRDMVFMDVESTGLGNSPLFLIGVMVWEEHGPEVRQYLARDYSEEAAVIASFVDLCRDKKLLITFNGKSYDLPHIRTRAAATGAPFVFEAAHLDLLHVSRRHWKGRLPDCRLQTLERFICERGRTGDIPGSEIPDAYHYYVQSGNAAQIIEILKHNAIDLLTLADLMSRLPDPPLESVK